MKQSFIHSIRLLLTFQLYFLTQAAFGETIREAASIPNPKLANQQAYVSDPDSNLSELERTSLDTLLEQLDKQGIEMGVVVLNSIGKQVPKDFTTELFNLWGIGKKGADNGLLLVLVLDQRRYELEPGYGLEGIYPDLLLKRLGEEFLVPELKNNNLAQGLNNLVRKIIELQQSPDRQDEIAYIMKRAQRKGIRSINPVELIAPALFMLGLGNFLVYYRVKHGKKTVYKPSTFHRYAWLNFHIIVVFILLDFSFDPLVVLFAYLFMTFLQLGFYIKQLSQVRHLQGSPKELYAKVTTFKSELMGTPDDFAYFPVSLYAKYWFKKKLSQLREMPRTCPSCSSTIKAKLPEDKEDEYLHPGQVKEEELGSVDYDVWLCTCGQTVIDYYAQKSAYSACPQCNYHAFGVSSSHVIEAPTYTSNGLGLRVSKCQHCGYSSEANYTIPKLTPPSSSSNSSSSDSSGGSFGGGSSGGAGAGGNW